MVDLRAHKAGYSVLNALYEIQSPIPPLTFLGRLFGMSPLADEARSWYKGLAGEELVGNSLDKLKNSGYVVLHSVPVGVKGSDIDHVVITPTGMLYVINTKNHADKNIWIAGNVVKVAGQNEPYARNSKYEATRTEKLLKDRSILATVMPLLVFCNPKTLTVKPTAQVKGINANNIISYLKSEEKSRSKAKLSLLNMEDYLPLFESNFWTPAYVDETHLQEERWAWYRNLKKKIGQAQRRRGFLGLVGLVLLGYLIFSLISHFSV